MSSPKRVVSEALWSDGRTKPVATSHTFHAESLESRYDEVTIRRPSWSKCTHVEYQMPDGCASISRCCAHCCFSVSFTYKCSDPSEGESLEGMSRSMISQTRAEHHRDPVLGVADVDSFRLDSQLNQMLMLWTVAVVDDDDGVW